MTNLIGENDVIATINDISDWISAAKHKDVATYYIGHLISDRVRDYKNMRDLNFTGDYVYKQYQAGLISPVQVRLGKEKFCYQIQRTAARKHY